MSKTMMGGMPMKAMATDLCNNILVRGKRDGQPITPMKLQKLMYYVCRDYVKETGCLPISEQFEVWQYGPVLPSVYAEFKSFGSSPIKSFAKDATGKSYKVSEEDNPILSRILDMVWAKNKMLTGVQLSRLTHSTGSGWYKAFMEGRERITQEDMLSDNS